MTLRLKASTKLSLIDSIIVEALNAVQNSFPKKILSAYLTGSYANGYNVPTSDIDLLLVFAGTLTHDDEKLGDEINRKLEYLTPSVDIAFRGLADLLETGEVGMRDHFFHLYGEPHHTQIPLPRIEDYMYRAMHAAYLRMQLTRKSKPHHWPLNFYDEQSLLKGFGWREPIKWNGKNFDSIKEIVVLTGWMATGLIAWIGKTYVPTKNHAVSLFKSTVGGQVADDFELITNLCRIKWSYIVPESTEDLQELQKLFPKILSIENFFLKNYQDFLIENLKNSNPKRVRTSIIRLGEVLYPNDRSLKALQELQLNNSVHTNELRKSISALLTKSS